ncbi:hypothetical protein BH09MYX1_BH09MYX1_25770 [soil metagenome]
MTRSYDLVSVDVWDTILRRSVHPGEVKVHVARWLQLHHHDSLHPAYAGDLRALFRARCEVEGKLAAAGKAAGHDDEYTLAEVHRAWIETVSTAEPSPELLRELDACEMTFERSTITLDPGILAVLEAHPGIPLVIASDFYMDARALEALVRHAGFSLPLRAVYVSADHRLSKRSGRLFEKIQRDLSVAPGRHLHIGDNPRSDVEVPRRLGMSAIHYLHPRSDRERTRSSDRFAWRDQERSALGLLHLAQRNARVPRHLDGIARECFSLGVRHGLPFFAFVYAVLEDVIRKKHDRIHYFTREGVFFQRIHDEIRAHRPFPGPIPSSDLLAVSRVSTFSASLGEPTTDEMMRVWRLYSTQSMGALFTTLGFDLRDYVALLSTHRIDPAKPIQYPWTDERVQRLFADETFLTRMRAAIEARRTPILRYLAEHGLTTSTKRAAVVDIGWRGTIQDNVAELLPQTLFEGYYVGLNRFLNPQPANVLKHGLFCDVNAGQAPHLGLEFPSVVEMLCNSATGSALRYEVDGEVVRAKTESHDAEDRIWHEYTKWFQAGVVELTGRLAEGLRLHHVEANELLVLGRRQLAALIAKPPLILIEAYFGLRHNEGFGLGEFVQKRARFPTSLGALERSGWPQGLLRYFRLGALTPLYNSRVLRLDVDGGVHRA